jgi:predicted nucleic acid-binding protein
MTDLRRVVFDTNVFSLLQKVDGCCGLVELLCDNYQGKGYADHSQLAKMDYCLDLKNKLGEVIISDEEVAMFIFGYQGKLSLMRINSDPSDLKLVLFAKNGANAVFLTGERKLLQLSDELGIEHWCFKAALHQLDKALGQGAIFDDPNYRTSEMFEEPGDEPHPFFHFAVVNRCKECNPTGNCPTKNYPPVKPM